MAFDRYHSQFNFNTHSYREIATLHLADEKKCLKIVRIYYTHNKSLPSGHFGISCLFLTTFLSFFLCYANYGF